MTKYLDSKFDFAYGSSQAYRDNYDAIFKPKKCTTCNGEQWIEKDADVLAHILRPVYTPCPKCNPETPA